MPGDEAGSPGRFRRPDGSWDWEAEAAEGDERRGPALLGRLAALLDGGGSRRALTPALAGVLAAALAGAALAGRRNLPSVEQLAALGPAAALAAPMVLAAAACLLFAQAAEDASAAAEGWRTFAARGANPAQLLALACGPRTLTVLLTGLVVPCMVGPLLALLPLHAPGRGGTALLGGALSWGLPSGVALAACSVAGAWVPVLRGRPHFRTLGAQPEPWPLRAWLDVLLAAAAAALGLGAAVFARNAGAAAAAAALNGPAFSSGGLPPVSVPPPHFPLAPLVYLAPAGFAAGTALLGARAARAVAVAWDRRRGTVLPSAAVLAVRSIARGDGWRPLCAPALAACAAVFALSGAPTASHTAATIRQFAAGADLRLRETWPAPCAGFCTEQLLRVLPVPDVDGANAHLPGVRRTTVLVPASDQVGSGAGGTVPATLVGVQPASYGSTVRWPAGFAGQGARVLGLLAAHPGGVVLSADLASQTGLGPGGVLQSQLLGEAPVLAVVHGWPGLPPEADPFALTGWSTLRRALDRHGAYTSTGFPAYALLRLAPGAEQSRIVKALTDQSLTVDEVARGPGPAGSPLRAALWPLGLVASALAALACALPWTDGAALPSGEAEVALGGAGAAGRARRLVGATLGAAGLAWGAGWGAAAAHLFWPDLQLATGAVAGGVRVATPGWWLALVLACLAAARAWALTRGLADAPDPVVAGRLAPAPEGAEGSEPAAVAPPVPRRRARRALARGGGSLWVMAPLAARRLAAGWARLFGLAFGLLLAASVAATVPLYTAGALTRVLHAGLQPYNQRPAGAVLVRWLPPSSGAPGPGLTDAQAARLARLTRSVGARVGLPQTPLVQYRTTVDQQVIPASQVGNPYAAGVFYGGTSVDSLTDLAAHVRVVDGRLYRPTVARDGTLEAMVTQEAYTADHLRVGEVYLYPALAPGRYVRLRLVGVFMQLDPTGPFWPYRYYTSDFFVEPSAFSRLQRAGSVGLGEAAWYTTLKMNSLTATRVPAVIDGIQRVALEVGGVASGAAMDVSPYNELSAFLSREQTLSGLLSLVSVPVLAICLYFVAITAALIVAAEAGEIAVLASRGARSGQIVALYAFEWVMLAVPVALIGPFPAALFARAMGATQGFLRFTHHAPLPVFLGPVDFAYSAAAAGLGVAAALLPVLASLSRSIVAARLRASRTVEQPLWQRAYLDAAALALLALIWLAFRKASVQAGGGAAALVADPALYLLPPAFLLMVGLVVVRFLGWLLRTLDAVVGAWASPSLVLPLRRIGRLPAQFAPVLLLLCFTAALGSYAAAAARTLDQNLAAAARYQVGAQVQLQEVSPCSVMKPEIGVCLQYDDVPIGPQGVRPMPPFSLHRGIPGLRRAAELVEEQATVQGPLGSAQADLVLVDPASYARVAWWMNGLNPRPLSRYVQLLGSQPDAALVDPALAGPTGVSPGGPFTIDDGVVSGVLTAVAPVLRWPGADANAPLVVANLSYLEKALGFIPAYRTALLTLAPGARLPAVENALAARGIFTQSVAVADREVEAALTTPEWAGQTGMLSVGFLAALGITVLGYLLYAGVMLRGQLSQLGLLRALGLPWGSLLGAVAVEQGTLLACGAAGGALAGVAAATLFLPLFRPAFTGPGAPPFVALGPGDALGQVAGVLAALLAAALAALLSLLRRMHVGETIKLEE